MSSTLEVVTSPAPPVVSEVAAGVFAYVQPDGTWWINNTGFLVGRQRCIAIDACSTERRTRALIAAIGARSSQPVQTLVNTHHHGDHTHGNSLFSEATIVAHDRTREEILAEGRPGTSPLLQTGLWEPVDWGDLELAPPFLTYSDGVTLWSDQIRCDVRYIGSPAHSTNDSVVWLPEERVLFAGDLLFNGGTPFLLAGSVAGAIEAVSALTAYDAETIVPGHGPVCGPEIIEQVHSYYEFVLDVARQGQAAGLTPLEAAREADTSPFEHLSDGERLVGNLHRAYAELAGAERGAPIDFASALADMRELNGGRPLSCLA